MLEIFTNMPQKSNFMPKSRNFGKICKNMLNQVWAHFTQIFLNRKRNIDVLKNLQPEKYAKAYFAFP